jgi:serine/threonine protein kinase
MKGLLEGVAFIHENEYIHRDLKPANILLDGKGSSGVKIVDFGLSAMHNPLKSDENINERFGTLVYMPPEQAHSQNYTNRVDIWACGIIMYQLLCGGGQHPLYRKGDGKESYKEKLKAQVNEKWEFPSDFTPLARDYFENLCRFRSADRYTAK